MKATSASEQNFGGLLSRCSASFQLVPLPRTAETLRSRCAGARSAATAITSIGMTVAATAGAPWAVPFVPQLHCGTHLPSRLHRPARAQWSCARKRVPKWSIGTRTKRMYTSRAALDRLLGPSNTFVTLATLNRAAKALGRKVKIELVPA
jgi:hypothetical protein